MAKHTTRKIADPKKPLPPLATETGDEFDNLPAQTSQTQINGWFTPSDKRELPQVVKGTILDCCYRKKPKPNQNPRYLVIELAAPVIGFRMNDDEEAYEDTLNVGEVVGLDMRQALEKLDEHRDKVKIVFIEKIELDDGRNWWKTAIYAQLANAPKNNGNLNANAKGPLGGDPIDNDNLPF